MLEEILELFDHKMPKEEERQVTGSSPQGGKKTI